MKQSRNRRPSRSHTQGPLRCASMMSRPAERMTRTFWGFKNRAKSSRARCLASGSGMKSISVAQSP